MVRNPLHGMLPVATFYEYNNEIEIAYKNIHNYLSALHTDHSWALKDNCGYAKALHYLHYRYHNILFKGTSESPPGKKTMAACI